MAKHAFQEIKTNGIRLRTVVEGDGPLVMLIHGWPESWYSWRHQLAPLQAAGFRTCAIDLRGYGGSDCPEPIDAYGMETKVDDVVGVIEALGEQDALLVGHDAGAPIAWNTALLHPERVRAVGLMSVPYLARIPIRPMELWKRVYQDRFFYQLYFQEPGKAEAELEADVAASLRKIYFSASGEAEAAYSALEVPPAQKVKGDDLLSGMIDPDPLPGWLSQEDVDYYVRQFKKAGFRGGLNTYRNLDRDWEQLSRLEGAKIEQPTLFIAGSRDSVLKMVPGVSLLDHMDGNYADLRGKVVIDGAGHWVQQERPEEVNRALLDFLSALE